MKGRLNEETRYFEVFYKGNWVMLDVKNWFFVRREITIEFLITLYYDADKLFKEKAIIEFKRRVKYDFDLKSLWDYSLIADRVLADLALDEIYDQSGRLYRLPLNCDR